MYQYRIQGVNDRCLSPYIIFHQVMINAKSKYLRHRQEFLHSCKAGKARWPENQARVCEVVCWQHLIFLTLCILSGQAESMKKIKIFDYSGRLADIQIDFASLT